MQIGAHPLPPYKPNCTRTFHSTEKPVTTMLTYPWKCTVLHCNHLGNTWKPLVLMTRHFDYCRALARVIIKVFLTFVVVTDLFAQ